MNKRLSKVLVSAFILFSVFTFTTTGAVNAHGSEKATAASNSAFLTIAQGAALGIRPGMADKKGEIPSITAQPGSSLAANVVVPNSASGCNQNVCIEITGKGLNVSDWYTSSYSSESTCTYAAYWVNGVVEVTSEAICGGVDTNYSSDWSEPGNFAKKTKVCNTWLTIGGKPCETIG